MAKSRRKASGATRGRLRLKRMGKGYSTMRKQRGSEKPIDRSKSSGDSADDRSSDDRDEKGAES